MKKFMIVFGIALLLSISASAKPIEITDCFVAWGFSVPGNNFTNDNWTFGEVFAPNWTIRVNLLGYYGSVGGFNSSHPVGIFDANGNLLVSTVIDNTSNYTSNHFVFNQVPLVTLFAGQQYIVEGVSNTDPYTWNDPGFTVWPGITVLGNNWTLGAGLTFNGMFVINDVADGYWGPNFGATPEPASLVLFGTGLLGLAGTLRRRFLR